MKRTIRFQDSIVGGEDKLSIVEILPQVKDSFRQRKTYFEYYFNEIEIEISLEQLDKLSQEFPIKINYDEIIVLDIWNS